VAADSIDVVYHSHFFEHLDREIAEVFLEEAKRVLRPGGLHRIVVPDFEKACRDYVSHLALCESNAAEWEKHDEYVALLIEQSVRKKACGTSQQKSMWRFIENILRGDARRRGETHQWMYDRFNLSTLLLKHGYKDPVVREFNTSSIPNWPQYGLDMDVHGNEYKTESLYIEAIK
jgi:SAM-dependent methyltransferase